MKAEQPNQTYLDSDTEEENHRSQSFQNQTGISQNTLNAIEKKQQVEQESKQKNQEILEEQEAQKKIGIFLKLVQKIQSIFMPMNGQTIFFEKLVNMIMTNCQGEFFSKGKSF